jgi:hypothetical protein
VDLCHFKRRRTKCIHSLPNCEPGDTSRWLPPQFPTWDAATVEAGNLPVKRTATHIYFFGYEGSNPEVCFQQWFPSPFTDDSLDGSPSFLTSEHYVMYGKALLFGDEVVSWLRRYREKPRLLGRQGGYVSFRLTSSECTIGDWGKLR